jgi:CRISPR-associated endonuclease/helicase Cas3
MHPKLKKFLTVCLAKSSKDKIMIDDHNKNLHTIADDLKAKLKKTIQSISESMGFKKVDEFIVYLKYTIDWHDVGKIVKRWQDYIRAKFDQEVSGIKASIALPKMRHELYSALHFLAHVLYPNESFEDGYRKIVNAIKSGEGSEKHRILLNSMKELPEKDIASLIAILSHHRKLHRSVLKRWEKGTWIDYDLFKFLFLFLKRVVTENNVAKDISIEDVLRFRNRINSVRVLLQMNDQIASASEGDPKTIKHIMTGPTWEYSYDFPFRGKKKGMRGPSCHLRNQAQTTIHKIAKDYDYIIFRARPGSGKSLCGLDFANFKMKNKHSNIEHVLFLEPTKFTIEAMHKSFDGMKTKKGKRRQIFPRPELYHSSSSLFSEEYERKVNGLSTDEARKVTKAKKLLLRGMFYPFMITTVDQLCYALAGLNENSHRVIMNLLHSVVIIDEIDFFDRYTMENIFALVGLLKSVGVPVMIMSATTPNIYVRRFEKMGFHVVEDEADYDVPKFNMRVYDKNNDSPERFFQHYPELVRRIKNGESIIIYRNTIKRVSDMETYCKNEFKDKNVIVFHGQFRGCDRKQIQDKIVDALGKKCWIDKDGNAIIPENTIIILSQIGELSLDISADIMITDACPYDRLMQRLGRAGRFHNRIVDVYVIIPKVNHRGSYRFYPAPYGRFLGPEQGWQAHPVMQTSAKKMKEGILSFRQLLDTVHEVYDEVEATGGFENEYAQAKENANRLLTMLRNNSVICAPNRDDDYEDGVIGDNDFEWKMRLILQKAKIYVIGDHDNNEDPIRYVKGALFSEENGEYILTFEDSHAKEEFDTKHIVEIPLYLSNKGAHTLIDESGNEMIFKTVKVRTRSWDGEYEEVQARFIKVGQNHYDSERGFVGI